MSRASKITLAATSLFALGTVAIVHFQQRFEQTAMHEGVVRDMEQQRLKQERKLDFDLQRALEAEYKKEQTVKDTSHGSPESGRGTQNSSSGGGGSPSPR